MNYSLELLTQIGEGIAKQFGTDCEVVIHDLTEKTLEHSIVFIANSQVTHRKVGDGPSQVVLEALKQKGTPKDHLGYLTRTKDGRILKSSTMFIRDEDGVPHYILSINYDITGLMTMDRSIRSLIDTKDPSEEKKPGQITLNVNDLLDSLIEQSIDLIGKPAVLMTKEEKITAIQFLNDAGAFLIQKSGDKISKYFGISKYTLYSYIDVNH